MRGKDRQLLAVMAVCLAVICLFVLYGLRAARSHYATTEQVMADYAAMAAETLAGRVKSRIGYGAGHQVMQALAETAGPWEERLVALRADSSLAEIVRDAVTGIAVGEAGSARCVAGSCGAVLAAALSGDAPGFRFRHRGDPSALDLLVTGTIDAAPVTVHYRAPAVSQWVMATLAAGPILPRVLADRMGAEQSLAVTLSDGETPVFASQDDTAGMRSAGLVLDDAYGGLLEGLTLTVGIAPAAADALVIGGLPADRVLLMLGLALVTLAVTGLLLRLIWRERQLVRAREGFVARVSHELRTPLAQIRLFCETLLLGREPDPTQQQRYLAIIDREARRLGQLVDNVLEFSDRQQATQRVVIEDVSLAPLLDELAEAQRPLAEARSMQIDVAVAGEVARADRDALRQVLLNLVDNATRHGAEGQHIGLSVSTVEDRVRIEVRDEGPGIAPEDRETIWGAFERRANVGTAGVGLGLAVARELVEAMHGECGLEDASGGGACAWVRLPVGRAD